MAVHPVAYFRHSTLNQPIMKKLRRLLILGSLCLIAACQDSLNYQAAVYSPQQFKLVGESHNKALDASLLTFRAKKAEIATRGDESRMTVSQILQLNKGAVIEFFENEGVPLHDDNIQFAIKKE